MMTKKKFHHSRRGPSFNNWPITFFWQFLINTSLHNFSWQFCIAISLGNFSSCFNRSNPCKHPLLRRWQNLVQAQTSGGTRNWSWLQLLQHHQVSKTPICFAIVENALIQRCGGEARQSHDGYQLLLGERIFLFYGWNRGSHPPNSEPLSRFE